MSHGGYDTVAMGCDRGDLDTDGVVAGSGETGVEGIGQVYAGGLGGIRAVAF